MPGIETGNNGEEGYKKIKLIGEVFKSKDNSFCSDLYLLFDNVGRTSYGGKEYNSYTSEEFITFIHNDSRLVKRFKIKYDEYKNKNKNYNIMRDDELKYEIDKKFKEFLKIKKDFENIFKGIGNNFCYRLFILFLDIQPSLGNPEKDLLFSKDFMQSIRNDTGLMDKFMKNSEAKKWYDNAIRLILKGILKTKLSNFSENGENSVKNERIKIIQDEFEGDTKFSEELYKILDKACEVKLNGKKLSIFKNKDEKEQEKILKEHNRKLIFSRRFMQIIHNNHEIEGYIRKNGGKLDKKITDLIRNEAINYLQEAENISAERETQNMREAKNRVGSLSKSISEEFKGMSIVPSLDSIEPTAQRLNINIHPGMEKYNGDKFSQLFLGNKQATERLNEIKGILSKKGLLIIKDDYILSYILYQKAKNNEVLDSAEKSQLVAYGKEIEKRSNIVEKYLTDNLKHDISYLNGIGNISEEDKNKFSDNIDEYINQSHELGKRFSNISILEEAQLIEFDKIIDQIQKDMSSLGETDSGILHLTNRLENYLKTEAIDENDKIGVAILFARILQWDDVRTKEDIQEFINTIKGEDTKYKERYENFIDERTVRDYEQETEYVVKTLTERYERAQKLAEAKKYYESDYSVILKTDTNSQDPSGLQIANGIDNIQNKLNHYRIKSDRTERENAALRYTAFDITFNNAFNLNDPIIQKLANLKIDLRSELSNYGIYNPDNNSYNKSSRDRFVAEKLLNKGLTTEEIEDLGKTMEFMPSEVEKNYEILCGDFDADQNSFEKIAKIYALGEVIDKIKSLFSNINCGKLGNFMGIQLDEKEPAIVEGDCLFLKGKINGTETNIKYDLRTGKLYMNSFTEQTSNPPMIVVGNTKPSREIGELGSFEDAISNIDSIFHMQNEDENTENLGNSDLGDSPKNDTNANENPDVLIKKKLTNDLENIGKIVKEKAGEQGKENNVINDLLKTFNILPDYGELKDIEFMGGSKLFILLESIKNTNNESDLVKFSNQMKELMSMCELSRGKNNDSPHKSEFSSITIFDIDEDNAATDIISLQKANKNFFLNDSGEKKKLESSKSHFDSSVQLSFADIIVQKCCKNTGNGRKISTAEMETFINSIKYNISDGKDLAACEKMFEDDYMLT